LDATRSPAVPEPAAAPARGGRRHRGRALAFVPLVRLTSVGTAILGGRIREGLRAPFAPRGEREERRAALRRREAERLAAALGDLKGPYAKLGQFAALRYDALSPEVRGAFASLRDAVPPLPFPEIRDCVEAELGTSLEGAFGTFDAEPVGAASIAQVHRARLHDGREVAVKVQYPDIEEIVRTDIRNLRRACRVYERFDPQPLELLPLLDELVSHTALELDFLREADSADRVRRLFAANPRVIVPAIHRELSTRRVLVMERVGGIKITEKAALVAAGLDPVDVVQDLMDVWVRMILAEGFFQADPHPGNLFVTPDGKLVLLDFGLSKELPKGFGLGLFELMFSMMTLNEAAMLRAFEELGFRTKTGDSSTFLLIARRMMERSESGRFEGEFTEEMTGELFEAIRENPVVRVPTDFVLVGRAFGLLSGIAHTLGSRANVLQAMRGG
jgi:predicted unusual protein kinase regulating ubiquinone biosynthesis (AarF/ABC1/UbiB family)